MQCLPVDSGMLLSLTQEQKEVLKQNCTAFYENFDCNEHFVAQLISENILNEGQVEELIAKPAHERSNLLMFWLLKFSLGQFGKFRDILKRSQPHVAELLQI